jgi:hypothetical protein
MQNGGKRAVCVWHRRYGKDSNGLNYTAKAAFERVGVYWHVYPEAKWAKKAVWNNLDDDGRRVIDQVFPHDIRKKSDEQDMSIELINGSYWQLLGSDRLNVVGPNPVGVVFSEYSIGKPQAWDLVRPILAKNGGWAIFIFTPRGKNHGWEIYQAALNTPGWFAEVLTVEDTGDISLEAIEDDRKSGMSEAMIRQEYYCDWDIALQGAYYGKQMNQAVTDGRITAVPYDSIMPVHTAWDLGMSDNTVIWFFQASPGGEIRLIDYYENNNEGLQHYAKVLQERGYIYGKHWAPHDIKVKELGTGKSRFEVAANLGITFDVANNIPIADGIQAARDILPRCWFDEEKCKQGIEALKSYRCEYDENKKTFKDTPLHDWASHPADAFRYLAVGHERIKYVPRDFGRNQRRGGRRRSKLAASYGVR